MNETTRQKYEQLKTSIEAAGFFAIIEADPALDATIDAAIDHRLVCASNRRTGGGYCGRSFWISFRGARCFLGTWTSLVYLVLDPARVDDLCICLLEMTFPGPIHDVPAYLQQEFALKQVEDLPGDSGSGEMGPGETGAIRFTSRKPEVIAAFKELDTLYLRLLEVGLLALRTAIRSGDREWSKAEVELLHNVPSLIGEQNIERHRYFWLSERELHISRLSAHGAEEPMMRMRTYYEPLWEQMEPLMLRLFERSDESETK